MKLLRVTGSKKYQQPLSPKPHPKVTTPQMLSIRFLLLKDDKIKYKAPCEVTASALTPDLHQEVYPEQIFFFSPRSVGWKGS